MRYVIVCLVTGEALEYHERLTNDICSRFNVKRQRLPAHFTIKAPFETEKIIEIEELTENFCINNSSADFSIKDFGHFRENVVYMDVIPSSNAVKVHDSYIDKLQSVPWLEWKKNEGKGKTFHCTIISKIPSGRFSEIWSYISNFNCYFELKLDNITILRWDKDRWILHKRFTLKNER